MAKAVAVGLATGSGVAGRRLEVEGVGWSAGMALYFPREGSVVSDVLADAGQQDTVGFWKWAKEGKVEEKWTGLFPGVDGSAVCGKE